MQKQNYSYILDFSNVKYYSEIHEIIKKELNFPDFYGRNWDAFWDCLTDMYGEEFNLEVIGLTKLHEALGKEIEKDISKIKEILYRFKHNYDNMFSDLITIKIIDGDFEYYID